jgi:NitT/TauT family transport system permease protein
LRRRSPPPSASPRWPATASCSPTSWQRFAFSVIGFVIGCTCGIALPFLLRLSPRATEAVEPFIMASQGIPKYALTPWLILWFGIGDAPKAIVVTLFVFYITFITVFAGVRSVDQRLVNMARILGASERTIARKVIWISLLPFFFTGLKIALPRAVSAAIVGEFWWRSKASVSRSNGRASFPTPPASLPASLSRWRWC